MRSIDRWRGLPRRILGVLARAAGGRVVLSALLLAIGIPTAFSADDALVLGVFPHLTAKKTIEVYPLADTLEKHLRPACRHHQDRRPVHP